MGSGDSVPVGIECLASHYSQRMDHQQFLSPTETRTAGPDSTAGRSSMHRVVAEAATEGEGWGQPGQSEERWRRPSAGTLLPVRTSLAAGAGRGSAAAARECSKQTLAAVVAVAAEFQLSLECVAEEWVWQ